MAKKRTIRSIPQERTRAREQDPRERAKNFADAKELSDLVRRFTGEQTDNAADDAGNQADQQAAREQQLLVITRLPTPVPLPTLPPIVQPSPTPGGVTR